MSYNTEDLDRFAAYTPRSQRPQPQPARPAPKKRRRIRYAPILALLLVVSLIFTIGFASANASQKKKNEELSQQIAQIQTDLAKTQGELDKFKNTFGTADLPVLADDKSNYDEVVGAYEGQIAGLVNKLSELRSELNEVKGVTETGADTAEGEQEDTRKVCYLTFDDGPSENTLKVLDVLKRYNAKDTTVEALPEMIEHLAAEGFVFEALTPDSRAFHHGVNN